MHEFQRSFNYSDNIKESYFSAQKTFHGNFIGGIKNRWRSSTCHQCGKRQFQAGKAGKVRRLQYGRVMALV